jgi:hypothetical protein
MKYKYRTNEELKEIALKYNSKAEFRKKDPQARKAAYRRNILDDICQHMKPLLKYRTNEELTQEALKYTTRGEFRENNNNAYCVAQTRGILDDICSHMPKDSKIGKHSHNFKWTDEKLQEEALKYTTRSEFYEKSGGAYKAICDKGILDQICSHMPKRTEQVGENNPHFRWTFEKLQEEALKYKTRGEFREKNGSAYGTANDRNLLDDICSHMKPVINISSQEKSLFDSIKEKYPKTQRLKDTKVKIKDKSHIKGFDIDIYIPELRKGIEFDGRYWHSLDGLKRSRSHWPEEDIRKLPFP